MISVQIVFLDYLCTYLPICFQRTLSPPPENLTVFCCFQRVEKGYIVNKWVKVFYCPLELSFASAEFEKKYHYMGLLEQKMLPKSRNSGNKICNYQKKCLALLWHCQAKWKTDERVLYWYLLFASQSKLTIKKMDAINVVSLNKIDVHIPKNACLSSGWWEFFCMTKISGTFTELFITKVQE